MSAVLTSAAPVPAGPSRVGHDLRLVPVALVAWAGALALVHLPATAGVGIGVGGGVVIATLALLRRGQARSIAASFAVAAAVFALVATSVLVQQRSRDVPVLAEAAASGISLDVTVTVSGQCARWERRSVTEMRCPAMLNAVSRPGTVAGSVEEWQMRTSVDVVVADSVLAATSGGQQPSLGLGATLQAQVRVLLPNRIGQAAYRLAVQQVLAVHEPQQWFGVADALRQQFRETAAQLPGWGGQLLPGLAIGDTTFVQSDLDEAMKASNLAHLTAVSGANCAIVVGAVLLLAARLRLRRWLRAVLAGLALLGFVVLVTPEPSVLRAAMMATIALAAGLHGRISRGMAALAATVVVLLCWNPWLSVSLGFALSVAATAGLLLLAGPLTRLLHRVLPLPLAAAIAIPLAAQLACQPILILIEPSIAVWGVLANILAAPAAPVATVLGLVACLLGVAIPWLHVALAWLAWLPATWIAACAAFFGDRVPVRLDWIEGVPGSLLLAAVTVAIVLVLMHRNVQVRSWTILALTLAVTVAAAVTVGRAIATRIALPADWWYAACDVGQGDATVLRSADQVMLVDTGDDPDALHACLDLLGIERIDVLVFSHFDTDHVGAAEQLVGRVDRVVFADADANAGSRLIEEFGTRGAALEPVSQGHSGGAGTGLRWQVLWPLAGNGHGLTGNAASVVLLVTTAAGNTALLLGDLGAQEQFRLRIVGIPTRVDVVKLAHHGSADQDPEFYHAIRGRVTTVSAGRGNAYGHPRSEILETVRSTGSVVARTDVDGTVVIAGIGDSLRIWRATGDQEGVTATAGQR